MKNEECRYMHGTECKSVIHFEIEISQEIHFLIRFDIKISLKRCFRKKKIPLTSIRALLPHTCKKVPGGVGHKIVKTCRIPEMPGVRDHV